MANFIPTTIADACDANQIVGKFLPDRGDRSVVYPAFIRSVAPTGGNGEADLFYLSGETVDMPDGTSAALVRLATRVPHYTSDAANTTEGFAFGHEVIPGD